MGRESEITTFQKLEARYYKIHDAHEYINHILDFAHSEGRELTEDDIVRIKENGALILEELYRYDALEITDEIVIVKDGVERIQNLATAEEVYLLEETLSSFVTE